MQFDGSCIAHMYVIVQYNLVNDIIIIIIIIIIISVVKLPLPISNA
jgi:hypothetical protein